MNYLTDTKASDPSLIKQLFHSVLPHEPVQTIHRLNGLVSHNYRINDHIIFKIASPITMPDKWQKQSIIAPLLQKRLGCHIPQVQYHQIRYAQDQTIPCIFYEQINGHCLSRKELVHQSEKFKEKYFERLAELTHRLHKIPHRDIPFYVQTRQEMAPELLGKVGPIQEKILLSLATPFLKYTYGAFPNQVLCHTDLHSENICLNKNDDIVGLLDFDNLCKAPAFMEFTPYLYHSHELKLWIKKYNQLSSEKITPTQQRYHQMLLGGYCVWAALGAIFNCYKKEEKDRIENLKRICQKLNRQQRTPSL